MPCKASPGGRLRHTAFVTITDRNKAEAHERVDLTAHQGLHSCEVAGRGFGFTEQSIELRSVHQEHTALGGDVLLIQSLRSCAQLFDVHVGGRATNVGANSRGRRSSVQSIDDDLVHATCDRLGDNLYQLPALIKIDVRLMEDVRVFGCDEIAHRCRNLGIGDVEGSYVRLRDAGGGNAFPDLRELNSVACNAGPHTGGAP